MLVSPSVFFFSSAYLRYQSLRPFLFRLRFPGIFRHGLLMLSLSVFARNSLILYTPATADWIVWISIPRFSIGRIPGNIIDDCNRRSHGHAEQSQDLRISGRGEQHHGCNGDRVEEQDHRVSRLHRRSLSSRSRNNSPRYSHHTVSPCTSLSKRVDRPDTADRLRNMVCDTAHRHTVCKLRVSIASVTILVNTKITGIRTIKSSASPRF